jgi:hypothetical protein
LIGRRRHSNILDVRSFRAADCDIDHFMVVAKVRERLAVMNKQISHRFSMERFNLNKLNEVEGKEEYRVEVSNRFAALEDLGAEMESNSAWEMIGENIKTSGKENLGYFELKKHKPWFGEGCSSLLFQRKSVKMQWLQNSSEKNGDNLNNVRCDDIIYSRNKRREYMNGRMNELATNSKMKNIRDIYRGINGFKRDYQPRNILVKDENVDLLADSSTKF